MGYNSVGACSSVNHLHFQLFNIKQAKEQYNVRQFYGEWLVESCLPKNNEERIREVDIKCGDKYLYACKVLTWDSKNFQSDEEIDLLTCIVYDKYLKPLHASNTPYNLIMQIQSLIIIPRQHQNLASDNSVFGAAIVELFGAHIIQNHEVYT